MFSSHAALDGFGLWAWLTKPEFWKLNLGQPTVRFLPPLAKTLHDLKAHLWVVQDLVHQQCYISSTIHRQHPKRHPITYRTQDQSLVAEA